MTEENKNSKSEFESEKESLEISGEELHVLLYGMLDKLVGLWHEDIGLDPSDVTLRDFIDWAYDDLRESLQDVVVLDSHDLDPSPNLEGEGENPDLYLWGTEKEPKLKLRSDQEASPELSGAAGLSAYDPNKPRPRRPTKPRGGGFSSR